MANSSRLLAKRRFINEVEQLKMVVAWCEACEAKRERLREKMKKIKDRKFLIGNKKKWKNKKKIN